MKFEYVKPDSLEEFASYYPEYSNVYFGVGTDPSNVLLQAVLKCIDDDEKLVIIQQGSRFLEDIEGPEKTPAIGAWCVKGVLVGFEYSESKVQELMNDARRFSA